MSPDTEFGYNSQMFNPPAPVVLVELRSPDSPNIPNPERLPALIDSGADGSAIPRVLIDSLRLGQVDEIIAGGYDDEEEDLVLQPVYSVHLTIPPLKPILAEVIPKDSGGYAIIGRNIINDWLLTLDGPKLKAYLKSTIETT